MTVTTTNTVNDEGTNQGSVDKSTFQMFLPGIISLVLLMIAIAFDNWLPNPGLQVG
jgi:Cd2+/Zn2+-exporting ATPase